MTLKVIGSGFGRTGTMTMKQALGTLGFGPVSHGGFFRASCPGHEFHTQGCRNRHNSDCQIVIIKMHYQGLENTVCGNAQFFGGFMAIGFA